MTAQIDGDHAVLVGKVRQLVHPDPRVEKHAVQQDDRLALPTRDDVDDPSVVHLDVLVLHVGRQVESGFGYVLSGRGRPRHETSLSDPTGRQDRPRSERGETRGAPGPRRTAHLERPAVALFELGE